MTTPPTNLRQFPARVGVLIPLDDLRRYVREFVDEHEKDEELKTGLEWTFELFLQWLQRKRQETTDEKRNTDSGSTGS